MNRLEFYCLSCGVNWTKGNYTDGCNECGGGALKRSCIVCDGKCGNIWEKIPLDSNDSSEAHWRGFCGLSPKEKIDIVQRKFEKQNEALHRKRRRTS